MITQMIHKVKSIELRKVEEGKTESGAYYCREINITFENGEHMCIDLFSDIGKEKLAI